MSQGIGSHGTLVDLKPAGSGTFTNIAELGDIQMPGYMRNEFDISSQNSNIDKFLFGILRREPLTAPIFWNKSIASQQAVQTAMLDSVVTTQMTCGFRITTPDGDVLIFSGGVKELKRTQPVDGAQTANIVIRATDVFMLNGTTYGA